MSSASPRSIARWIAPFLGLLLIASAPLAGCGVEGAWPYVTPSPTAAPPPPPSPEKPATPLVLAAVAPTATPRPTSTPVPTPTRTATPRPTDTPTATATATSLPATSGVARSDHFIVRGRAETGLVALTFDAGGRDGGHTGSVLDTLKRFETRATFFLTGEWSEANPALVRRMVAEGHELANHTYDHPHLPQIGDQEMLSQLTRTEQSIRRVAGVGLTKYVRPPFGDYNQRVVTLLGKHGYDVVYWSLDSGDWRAEMSVQDVATRIATQANAGDVVVLHCYPAKTAQALPAAMEGLRARSLRMGTLSEALGRPSPTPTSQATAPSPGTAPPAQPASPTPVPGDR